MRRHVKGLHRSGIIWLWLMLLVAAVTLTAASRAVVAAAVAPEQDFVPSENLPADAAVAFPVDI